MLGRAYAEAGAVASLDVQNIPARTFLYIVLIVRGKSVNDVAKLRFNNDSGANYSRRRSVNGAADGTAVSETGLIVESTASTVGNLVVCELMNIGGMDKHIAYKAGGGITAAASAPNRVEGQGFWDNELAQISRVTALCDGGANLAQYSELLVFGASV